MRIETIKGVIALIITIIVVIMSGLSSPLEVYTNTTNLLFSNKELIMIILIFIVFLLKNTKLSMMIYSSRQLTLPYLFYFLNNITINMLLVLMLLDANKLNLWVAALLIIGEFIIACTQLFAGGYVHNVQFSAVSIRIKEFLGLVTVIILTINGMPFALESWPIALILMITYTLFVLNLAINNMYTLIKNI